MLRRNTHVDLATGRRTDQLIGDGQVVDVPQQLSITAKDLEFLQSREFSGAEIVGFPPATAAPKWIRFVPTPSTGKTERWEVETLTGNLLGHVRWHGAWRQYAFDSLLSVYEPRCLRDIANFCETKTREYRKNWKTRK